MPPYPTQSQQFSTNKPQSLPRKQLYGPERKRCLLSSYFFCICVTIFYRSVCSFLFFRSGVGPLFSSGALVLCSILFCPVYYISCKTIHTCNFNTAGSCCLNRERIGVRGGETKGDETTTKTMIDGIVAALFVVFGGSYENRVLFGDFLPRQLERT
jgi:hypothetical protein